MRVVLIQDGCRAVIDRQRGVADGPVRGGAERGDHELQVAELQRHPRLGADEVRVAEGDEVLLEVIGGVLRQQHPDVLRDVALEHRRVEVVAVPVRDIEEVGRAVPLPVERAVVGEREPRAEEARSDHGVAEDAAARGLDEHSRVAEAGDLHFAPVRENPSSLRGGLLCAGWARRHRAPAAPRRRVSRRGSPGCRRHPVCSRRPRRRRAPRGTGRPCAAAARAPSPPRCPRR